MANIKAQQLIFDVSVSDQATAMSAQNRISAITNDIAACIESVLEKYDDPDAFISIHHLELHLGPIDSAHLEEELLQGIAGALHQKMAQVHVPAPISTLPAKTQVKRRTLAEHEEDVIRHFLSTGLAIDQTTDLKITKTRIRKALCEIPALVEWFIHAQGQSTDLLKRLLYHLDDSDVHALVFGQYFLALETIFELIKSLSCPERLSQAGISYETVRFHVWRCVFNQKAGGRTTFDYFEFVEDYIREVSIPPHECIVSLPKPVMDELLKSKHAERVRRYLSDYGTIDRYYTQDGVLESGERKSKALHYTQEEVLESGDIKSEAFYYTQDEVSERSDSKSAVADGTTERLQKDSEGKPTENIVIERQESKTGHAHTDLSVAQKVTKDGHIEVADKFYLHNGGIVLVAPFLGHFFTSLGFIKNDQFVNQEKQERSVVLLHYLHPWQEVSEDSLILNKVLCGLDILDPVPIGIEPTPVELEEIDELIRSVVHHWSALRETSVQGFKQSFLNRAAILTEGDHQWHLRIERECVDVLLETLPWSISVIKHPWMKKMIMVEW